MSTKTEYIYDSANNGSRTITVHTDRSYNTTVYAAQEYVRISDEDEPKDLVFIANNRSNQVFTDSTFDIIAQREEEQGCPLAQY